MLDPHEVAAGAARPRPDAGDRAVTDISANLSVPTLDEKAWRASEPHTPHPRERLEAVAELNRAGIPTGDPRRAADARASTTTRARSRGSCEAAAEAGATSVGGIALHLRGEVRGVFMDWLRSYRPDLVERYEELYARGAYAPREEQGRIQPLLRSAQAGPDTRRSGRPRSSAASKKTDANRKRGAIGT